MDLLKFIFACSILVPLVSSTYIYRRPIVYSRLDPNEGPSQFSERHDQSSPSVKKGNTNEKTADSDLVNTGLPVNTPLFLVPIRAEAEHGGGSGGAFGAFGALAIPGLHLNLGGGNGFGGSLSASGGISGHYGGHGVQHGHAGGFAGALVTPVHYGYPIYNRYPVHQVGGAGGFAAAGAHQGFYPYYAGHGIHHIKSEAPGVGILTLTPTGSIVGPHKDNENQEKQPEVLEEVSNQQEEVQQSVIPSGFHHPGFIASSAGRLGYPVLMASPEQLQELSLRQNPNPFAQFFQRPFQILQMFIRPTASNSSKQPEKPETGKPVVESAATGNTASGNAVGVTPNNEKQNVSQTVNSSPSENKVQQSKQNSTDSTSQNKKPSGAAASASVDKKEKKERPKPSVAGVSDVIASVNEVVKATSAVNAGSAPVLPVFVDEADSKAREDGDVKDTLDTAVEDNTDANVNAFPEESALDMESKPVVA